MTRRSPLAASLLCCMSVIHAASLPLAAKPSPNISNTAQVARAWLRSYIGGATAGVGAQDLSNTVAANATDVTAYLRIASLSIALYDVFVTVDGEVRLYASQPSLFKMSRACALFIAVRYTSIAAIITSNVGFFGTGFSEAVCEYYHLLPPILKVFAVIFSQLILSVRTYAISRKEPWVLYTLSILFVSCTTLEFFANTWRRVPVQNDRGNCQSGNEGVKVLWLHYLAAMAFDAVAMGISTAYLVVQTSNLNLLFGLSRLMLKEGMVYFVVLACANIVNLIFFRSGSIAMQSSAASLGIAFTMIMSQRVILSLHDWRAVSTFAYSSNHEIGLVSFPENGGGNPSSAGRLRSLSTNRALSHALSPSNFEHGNGINGPTTFEGGGGRRLCKCGERMRSPVPEFVSPRKGGDGCDIPVGIRVQVHEEIKRDCDSAVNVYHSNIDRKLDYA